MSIKNFLIIILTVILFNVSWVYPNGLDRSRSAGEAPKDIKKAEIEKIADGIFRIGTVILDKNKGEIKIPARVNQREGVIELVLCTTWGRTHESIFTTETYPVYLQTALLLLGLKYGAPAEFPGAELSVKADTAEIFVETDNDSDNRWRIEDFVYDNQTKKPMAHIGWIYTGSQFFDGFFYAQEEGSIITTYHDPNTMFDNPLPEGTDDTVCYVNIDLISRLGDNVTIIFCKKPDAK
ncbi:hypothetical protein J7L67_05350 [bacterium]|nr:hypothetical protein [bacterium]